MGWIDYILIALVLSFAFFLLYRAFFKKKGVCAGCSSGSCQVNQQYLGQESCPYVKSIL